MNAKLIVRKAATAFYALLMIEVIIIISPFAFYWYSFYSPLQTLHRWRSTAWLETFILPHSVITQSGFLEFLRWVAGPYLLSLGIGGFVVCALQIYTSKLRAKGLVTNGIYRYVR